MAPKNTSLKLDKMAQNERVELFLEQFSEPIVIQKESQHIYLYRKNIWLLIDDYDLSDFVVSFFDKNNTSYSAKSIDSFISTLKKKLPKMGTMSNEYIAFNNGVIHRLTGDFKSHSSLNWITSVIPHDYSISAKQTSNFDKWLISVSENSEEKKLRILSALYMILTNRYNWQMFIEITGKGGSGKSIFAHIARLLAGEDNCINISLSALENENIRDGLINKTLIIANDQSKFTGDGSTLRAITGGDPIFINPKYKRPFNATIHAVFVMTNNTPAFFTENNGGISRRRILFRFDNVIPFYDRDENLPQKLEKEIAGVVAKIINTFNTPNEAKNHLEQQRKSKEAQSIKSELDPLFSFAHHLQTSNVIEGLYIGSKKTDLELTHQSIYPLYLKYCELNDMDNCISSNQFRERLSNIMAEQGNKYPLKIKLKNNKTITNVYFRDNNFLNRLLNGEY